MTLARIHGSFSLDCRCRSSKVISVLGGGAIGGLYAHELRHSGHAVSLLVRNPSSTRSTIRVDYTSESRHGECEVDIEKSSGGGPPIHALICTAKAYDIPAALSDLRSRLLNDTGVLLVHNGIFTRPVRDLLPTVDPQNVFAGITMHAVISHARPPNAHVALAARGYLKMGLYDRTMHELSPSSKALALLTALTRCKTLDASHLDPAAYYRASRIKLGINAPYNYSTGIMNARNGKVVAPQPFKKLSRMITDELAAILEAERIALDLGEADPTLTGEALHLANIEAMNLTATSLSTTLQDLRNGKRTEMRASFTPRSEQLD